jgi:dihydrofolate reductase
MGTVVASFCTSLDGFIADPDDNVGPLFDWYFNGDVEIRPPGYPITLRVSEPSATYFSEFMARGEGGAIVCGRRLFDHTNGWGGSSPGGSPVFVVTHRAAPENWISDPDVPYTFVTNGVESAVAQAKAAGNGNVGVTGASIAQQCLNLGLLDEVRIDVVPVLLGKGIRYFDNITNTAATFERMEVVLGDGVTHMRYRVTYS